jgi:hypothetical protein
MKQAETIEPLQIEQYPDEPIECEIIEETDTTEEEMVLYTENEDIETFYFNSDKSVVDEYRNTKEKITFTKEGYMNESTSNENVVVEGGAAIREDESQPKDHWIVTKYEGDGEALSDPILLEDTIDTSGSGWVNAEYQSVDISEVNYHYYPGGVNKNDSTVETQYGHTRVLKAFKHQIPKQFKQYDDNGVLCWEAFDIPFRPYWKMHVAKYMNGLSTADAIIVRLLNKSVPPNCCCYLSVYMNNEVLSSSLKAFESQAKSNQEKLNAFIKYNHAYKDDPNYTHFMSLLEYAYYLNKSTDFSIVEQIADYRFNGTNELLLSPYSSKTEIREEWNIFTGRPSMVFTNYAPQVMLCTNDDVYKRFIVRKFVSKF